MGDINTGCLALILIPSLWICTAIISVFMMTEGWGIKPESWPIIIVGSLVQIMLGGLIALLGRVK
jgi:hypothetical protein